MIERAPEPPGGDIWRLPAAAERQAERLLELGARGVGGFRAAGRDDQGIWLARSTGPTLASWLGDQPIAWQDAARRIRSLAEAMAACEEAALFPGPIDPDSITVEGEALAIRADALAAAIAGRPRPEASAPGTRWLAPEQAAGAPPDSAGNRYLAGLLLYRLLSGEHPFAGRGLRLGLEDQAQRGAPPFPDEVARSLPPGLQSTCLRLLDPDPSKRPGTAREIASCLDDFLQKKKVEPPKRQRTEEEVVVRAPSAPEENHSARPWRFGGSILLVPVIVGVAVAVWAVTSIDAAPAKKRVVVDRDPHLSEATELADCASCHPRQAAEWSRSVMAHSVESPLFQALEMLIQEQVGRDRDCPNGAGILRAAGPGACTSRATGQPITGSGGELWCVNCHAPGENLARSLPAWNALSRDSASRRPLRDLLPKRSMEGIGCAFCHQVGGPVRPGNEAAGLYEGNPSWLSVDTGSRFGMRPEDRTGVFGIGNSGYFVDPSELLASGGGELVPGGSHARPSPSARAYLASSEFCGSCHDVRLFGTDSLTGEHFKRLRNAYSEWAAWKDQELRAGRPAASCQDCHMSQYPGVCAPAPGAAGGSGCPPGTRFEERPPGSYATGRAATGAPTSKVTNHYFSGVDVPLAGAFDQRAIDETTIDVSGIPLGARQRRDLLLARALRLELGEVRRAGRRLEVPITVENVGAGHKVPAGFSQEREIWVHLTITDARGRTVYEVGRVDRGDQDLRDKVFVRVNTSSAPSDGFGRAVGLFGADITDGPDLPDWTEFGAGDFRGRGLVNFQNGFLRCVRCIGVLDQRGRCLPAPGQEGRRADRYDDAVYDPDTGTCSSNLRGADAFFETYFPVGALDASRGLAKAPDAIIDTRSLAPGRPVRYVYELDPADGPLTIEARLLFRAFPPFLIRGFIDYEAEQDRRGLRPSGPLVDRTALDRLDVVELARVRAEVR